MMKKYLLDTSIIVELCRHELGGTTISLLNNTGGIRHWAISDITLYEMYAGAYSSKNPEASSAYVDSLSSWLEVIPSSLAYKEAAKQKVYLRQRGQQIEDIDILIASTAIVSGRILVTGNVKHMGRLQGVKIADWL